MYSYIKFSIEARPQDSGAVAFSEKWDAIVGILVCGENPDSTPTISVTPKKITYFCSIPPFTPYHVDVDKDENATD